MYFISTTDVWKIDFNKTTTWHSIEINSIFSCFCLSPQKVFGRFHHGESDMKTELSEVDKLTEVSLVSNSAATQKNGKL
jgi:hypothetical protein